MRNMILLIILFLTLIGPLFLLLSGNTDLHSDYRTANRASAHIAPDPKHTPEAIVQIYTARAFNWHGLFSIHSWIATKAKDAEEFTTYQVVGWRLYRGLPPLDIEKDLPDRYWYNQKPEILVDIRGKAAEKLVTDIDRVAHLYPNPNNYTLWPGPNSNTFTAYVIRNVPGLHIAFPANAVGKDYLTGWKIWAPALSHTGYQLSFFGVLGITVAKAEGIEINLLGFVFGINPLKFSITLPGIGEIKPLKSRASGKTPDSPLS